MNQIVVRTLELILCRLRAMLQGYLFTHLASLQEPSKTPLKPLLWLSRKLKSEIKLTVPHGVVLSILGCNPGQKIMANTMGIVK